jgi:hypothetical protein
MISKRPIKREQIRKENIHEFKTEIELMDKIFVGVELVFKKYIPK